MSGILASPMDELDGLLSSISFTNLISNVCLLVEEECDSFVLIESSDEGCDEAWVGKSSVNMILKKKMWRQNEDGKSMKWWKKI